MSSIYNRPFTEGYYKNNDVKLLFTLPDDGIGFSQNLASLKAFVHDVINLGHYEKWTNELWTAYSGYQRCS